jgi:hypothetical protein
MLMAPLSVAPATMRQVGGPAADLIAVANVDAVAGHAAGIIMNPERGRCAIPATGPIICYRD